MSSLVSALRIFQRTVEEQTTSLPVANAEEEQTTLLPETNAELKKDKKRKRKVPKKCLKQPRRKQERT